MKKFNKKTLSFVFISVLALTLVSAGIMAYYGQTATTVTVNQSIVFTVDGDVSTGERYMENVTCKVGETCLGENPYRITNNGDSDRTVALITSGNTNGINVSYVGQVELSTKNTTTWKETSEKKATVTHTLVGDRFETEVISDGNLSGYVLVYAMDKDERFDNFASVVLVKTVDGDLPYSSDWNANANPGYCGGENTFDSYDHCKGAKLWIVEESDLGTPDGEGVSPLSWDNMADYLYETDLIQYFDNDVGQITVPAGSFIEFFPQFSVDSKATTGDYVVYTTVN